MAQTILGIAVAALGLVFQQLGIPVAPESLENFLGLALEIGGLVWAWYARYSIGDITPLGGFKDPTVGGMRG